MTSSICFQVDYPFELFIYAYIYLYLKMINKFEYEKYTIDYKLIINTLKE